MSIKSVVQKIFGKKEQQGTVYIKPSEAGTVGGATAAKTGTSVTVAGSSGTTTFSASGGGVTSTGQGGFIGTSSGGGGGSISGISSSQANQIAALDTGLTPVPTPSKTGTVSAYKPASVKTIPSYFIKTLRQEGFGQAVKGSGQILVGGVKYDIQKEKEKAFKKRVKEAGGGFVVSEEEMKNAGLGKGYGTSTTLIYQQTPDSVLLKSASFGDNAALQAYVDRTQKRIEDEAKYLAAEKFSEDTKKVNTYANNIQGQINRGEISYEQGVNMLKTYSEDLDKNRASSIEQKLQPKIDSSQKIIDKTAKKGKIATVGLITAGSFIAGFATAPLIASAPKLVQTGVAIGGGVGLGVSVSKKTIEVAEGKAGVLDVAGLILPAAAFIGGGALGIKTFGASGKISPELNTALKTADLKPVSTKTLTSEAQIRLLKLSSNDKAELLNRLRAGESIGYKEWKIKAKDSRLQKIIDEQMPNTKIISFGKTENLGNIYSAKTIVKVSVGEGKSAYIDFNAGKTIGIYNSKTGLITAETITAKAELGKPVTEIGKTMELIKPRVQYFIDEKTGELKRAVGAESYSFEGMKIKVPEGKQITYKDLLEIKRAEEFKKYPSVKAEVAEIQKATSMKEINAVLKGETFVDALGLNLKEIKFTSEKIGGSVKNIPKPIEFERVPSTKSMKPFEFDITEDFNLKGSEKPSGKTKQILKQLKKQELDLSQISPQIPIEEIKLSVKKGIEKTTKSKQIPQVIPTGLSEGKIKLTKRQETLLSQTNVPAIKLRQVQKGVVITRKRGRIIQTPSPILTPAQVDKILQAQSQPQQQALRVKQLQQQIFNPRVQTPKIELPTTPSPVIPFPLPSKELGAGYQRSKRLLKKAKKKEAKYTASLAAAAFQTKPIRVSRKELKRLGKQIYSGIETRPVLEIIDEDTEKIGREAVKKVNF